MAKEKTNEIQGLIELGKERGFLTYEDINEALPENVLSADQIDDVLSVFDDLDIEIVEKEEDTKGIPVKKKKVPVKAEPAKNKNKDKEKDKEKEKEDEEEGEAEEGEEEPEEVEVTPDASFGKSSDPVRMYLRKMGAVALLNREGEV